MITICVIDPMTNHRVNAYLDEDELTWTAEAAGLTAVLDQLTEEFETSVYHGGMPDRHGNLARYVAKALHGKVIARDTEPEPGVVGRIYGHC